jgi:hypothetical protein
MMKRLIMIALACLAAGCAGCRTDRPPDHKMIEMAFFKCEKCHSLEGGIYGKGPFKSLRSPEAKTCVHDWQAIDMAQFKELGSEWRGADWTKEIPFWNSDTNGIPNNTSDGIRQPADGLPKPSR